LEAINPLTTIKIYLNERKYIDSEEAKTKLYNFIESANISVVIAHSLGGNYLIQTVNQLGLSESVKKVALLMSEMPNDYQITNPHIIDKIKKGSLAIENYYCFYDPTLLSSTIITRKLTAGNFGSKSEFINNYLYPLTLSKFRDPHSSILRDKKFFERLMQL
jgi:hypothetical protein